MRLLAPARSAMRSTRAPPSPKRANSPVAARRMRSLLRSGLRRLLRGAASLIGRAGVLDDAADLGDFVGEEAPELFGRAGGGVGAERKEAFLHLRQRHRLYDLGVEALHDLARRAGRREHGL